MSNHLEKVCLIGSGNWGTCIGNIVANNVKKRLDDTSLSGKSEASCWDKEVKMWVYEEIVNVDGKDGKLSEIINQQHENVKYLPGIKLPDNLVAVTDLIEAAREATLLIFVIPHQFIAKVCQQLSGKLHPSARAISLVKGLDCVTGKKDLQLVSLVINEQLGVDVSVLMGANLAWDIAHERFSESTIGFHQEANGKVWKELFETSYFRISLIKDVTGVELCGALKNIIAVGAGFIDGIYEQGKADNTKVAIMRKGLIEMKSLCRLIDEKVKDETFLESCGIADIIVSCYGGRNRRIGEAFVKEDGKKSIDQLEVELLGGQKLQGPATAQQVYFWLKERNLLHQFPLMTSIYRICYENLDPKRIFESVSA